MGLHVKLPVPGNDLGTRGIRRNTSRIGVPPASPGDGSGSGSSGSGSGVGSGSASQLGVVSEVGIKLKLKIKLNQSTCSGCTSST